MSRYRNNGSAATEAEIYLSFVIACHNERGCLAELHRRIDAAVRPFSESFEVVLVNDRSIDETWPEMLRLVAKHAEVVAVNLSRRFGQQAALSAGLSMARGKRVLVLDADLQDPPELLAELLAKMDDGADVVHARRRHRLGESLFKRLTAAFFYRVLNWLSDTRVERDCGEFRLLSRRAVDVLLRMPEQRRLLRGLAAWVGFEQAVVEYDRPARALGRSKFSPRVMLRLASDAITAFSIRPLRLASGFAAFCALTAFASAVFGIWGWMSGHASTTAALGAALICTLAAMQLMALGIIGEYLGRLYEQSLGRPHFIIDEVVMTPSLAPERRSSVKYPK